MKNRLYTLLCAVLTAACFLFPASAELVPGFRAIEVNGREITQKYVLEDSAAELFHLAAYDETGRLVGICVEAAVADGQEHELTLTAGGDVASVRLFQTTKQLVPVSDAVDLYRAPVFLGRVIADELTTTVFLYLEEVDINFDGHMNEVEVLPGDVVDYYLNEDGSITAQVTHYTLAQVTSVGSTVKLNGGEYTIAKEKFAGFAYEKGDYLLVVLNDEEDEVLASEKAATVSGQVKAIKGKNKFRIGGTFYENLTDTEISLMDEITVVLNKANQIVLVLDSQTPTPPTPGGSGGSSGDTPSVESAALYAVLIDSSYTYYENDNGIGRYTYTVFANGDEVEMAFSVPLELDEGAVFAYTVEKGQSVYAPQLHALLAGTIDAVDGTSLKIGGVEYTLSAKAEIITVTSVYTVNGTYDYTEAKDSGTPATGMETFFLADENANITTLYLFRSVT